MRIYQKILLATLPLLLGVILAGGLLSYDASRRALTTLAVEWLETKLADGVRAVREDEAVLRRYGLEAAPPNVAQAKAHAAGALSAIPFGRGGHFSVVDDQGLVVVHPEPHRVGTDISATDWFRQMQARTPGPTSFTWEGEQLLAVHAHFAPWGWYLVAGAPQAEVFGPVERMKARLAGLAALAALLAAAVLVVLARRLSAPLGALVLEADRIGGGDLRPVRVTGGATEIRVLGAAFDAMAGRLKRRIELETLVSDISRRFIDLPPDGVAPAIDQARARCEFSLPGDLWPAEVDAGQISQVIGNLVLNADQAMPEGGTIRVAAENVVVDESDGRLSPGRYLRLSVADEGVGIPAEDLLSVFDPYFTTKAEGSGLGLATAHSVVGRHRGRIEVRSRVGVGTTFEVYLPACDQPVPAGGAPGDAPPEGKGKILVMDDQELVCDAATAILRAGGYAVVATRDGAELVAAYRAAREAGTPYDAVILDLTVPGGMGGKEAMARLREIDPGVVGIVASGYSHDPVMADYRDYGFRAVVPKPFGARDLLTTVGNALAAR